jgi:hypothetical protein
VKINYSKIKFIVNNEIKPRDFPINEETNFFKHKEHVTRERKMGFPKRQEEKE